MYVFSCHARTGCDLTLKRFQVVYLQHNVMNFVYSFFMDALRTVFSRKGTVHYNYTGM